jgi:hypothetical protein
MRGMGSFAGNAGAKPRALVLRMQALTFWFESRESYVPDRDTFDCAPFGRSQRRQDCCPGYAAFPRSASIRLTTLRSTQRPNSRVSRASERPRGVSRYSTRGGTSG